MNGANCTMSVALAVSAGLLGACGLDNDQPLFVNVSRFELVWQQEFDGAAGSQPSTEFWNYDVGTGPNDDGWGNGELQYYRDSPNNIALDGNGNLVITARQEAFENRNYTSARMTTKAKFEQQYGRFEARMKLPPGGGLWPAFWMLGNNFPETAWPLVGEIDIMEFRGQDLDFISGAVHGPGYSQSESISRNYWKTSAPDFSADFHVFAVVWDPDRISFWVDDVNFGSIFPRDAPDDGEWVFDRRPFFLLLNLAVGGSFVGPVSPSTVFPASMEVDYVRVYRRVTASPDREN